MRFHDIPDLAAQKRLAHREQIGTMPIALLKRVHAQIEDQRAFNKGIEEAIPRLEMRLPGTETHGGHP